MNLPEIGKIYSLNNMTIPLWRAEIFEHKKIKINTEQDFISKIKDNEIFFILNYKIIEYNSEKDLLYCKVLKQDGIIGLFCIFKENFDSWVKKI